MSERWKLKSKPACMEARFEFNSFASLRSFLDEIADKAEALNHHPNISFGKEHVSVVIYGQAESLQEVDFALSDAMDKSFHHLTSNLQGAKA